MAVDHAPAPSRDSGDTDAIAEAPGALAQQPEVAVGHSADLMWLGFRYAFARLGNRPPADATVLGLDDLADEIHATIYRLQDGLALVEP